MNTNFPYSHIQKKWIGSVVPVQSRPNNSHFKPIKKKNTKTSVDLSVSQATLI